MPKGVYVRSKSKKSKVKKKTIATKRARKEKK